MNAKVMTKPCANCGRLFKKAETTSQSNWMRQESCSKSCSVMLTKKRVAAREMLEQASSNNLGAAMSNWRTA